MKQLKDYLSYYLGCDIMITHDFNTGNGHEKIYKNEIRSLTPQRLLYALDWDMQAHPILRRIEDITDEEAKQLIKITYQYYPEEIAVTVYLNEPKRNIKYCGGFAAKIDNAKREYIGGYAMHFDKFGTEQFHYLIKQGFDLFNLIDAGLAIDKKKLNG